MRFKLDFLKLLVTHRNLHNSVGKLQVLIEISNSVEKVFLIELILSLEVLNFDLRRLVLFSELFHNLTHIFNFILKTFVMFFNEKKVLFLFTFLLKKLLFFPLLVSELQLHLSLLLHLVALPIFESLTT